MHDDNEMVASDNGGYTINYVVFTDSSVVYFIITTVFNVV